jgi:hypothetical protein
MQPWVDKHPMLFVLFDVLFLYFTTALVVSWWSGWAVLARQFRLRTKFSDSKWRGQSGQMRWLCSYRGCLTIGGNSEDLYLATFSFFPPFHPPLFIPWNEVSLAKRNLLFITGVRFELGKETSVPLWVRERLAARLKSVAGTGYPIETLG